MVRPEPSIHTGSRYKGRRSRCAGERIPSISLLLTWLVCACELGVLPPLQGQQVLSDLKGRGMLRTQFLLKNSKRALAKWLGLRVLALGLVQARQVVVPGRQGGVLWAQRCFLDGDGGLEERVGLRVLALLPGLASHVGAEACRFRGL